MPVPRSDAAVQQQKSPLARRAVLPALEWQCAPLILRAALTRSASDATMLPLLQGTRILDFTTIVLGPYATQTLADLGADVVKIEPLQGDLFRTVRPGRSRSMGAGFLNFNRNKRSLAIDLKRPEARAVLARLVQGADVVVHNMRPKAAAQLGLAYEALAALSPGLVYAFAAGIAQRARTGRGCCIEAPMFESTVSFLMSEQLGGESFVPPLGPTGYDRLAAPNRRPFRTRDGYIAILPYNTAHWTAFFELIGQPEQAHSATVQDPVLRSQHVDALYAQLAAAAPSRTNAEWLDALRSRDIPCAPVNRVQDLLHDPHLVATGFFREFEHPTEGRLRDARSPFRVHGAPELPDRPAPRLGADAREVLAGLGFSAAEIGQLVAQSVLFIDD